MKQPSTSTAGVSREWHPPLQSPTDRDPWNVRALLESTATPFDIAEYGPRATIYTQGDPSDSVLHIDHGRVWLSVAARSGKEAIYGFLDAGAFLGEETLVGRSERRQSATAMVATRVITVAKADMMRMLRTQPGLMDRFVTHLLVRSARLEANLIDQLLYCSEQRLVQMLLLLANCDKRRLCRCALPGLPQEILAEMVGTTRSRVNAFMSKFKKLGFVEEEHGVLHVNPDRLYVVADGDLSLRRRTSAIQ